ALRDAGADAPGADPSGGQPTPRCRPADVLRAMPAGLTRRTVLALAAAALLLAGCGEDYAADIEAVKQAETAPGTANAKLVDELGGARGKVTWAGGKAPGENQGNPGKVPVNGHIYGPPRRS